MARLHAVTTNSIPAVPMGLNSTLKGERGGRREGVIFRHQGEQ